MTQGKSVLKNFQRLRDERPLIHNITNYVVMNFTANALLAVGAAPVMAHAVDEVDEMVKISKALVINIGTLEASWVQGMKRAAKTAYQNHIPVILDPAGVGATQYRNRTANEILHVAPPSVIRGNPSEIIALFRPLSKTKGVESLDSSEAALEPAKSVAHKYGCTVCVSGKVDFITNGSQVIEVHNGHSMMTQVTGMGCSASALIGAFLAVAPNSFEATVGAMVINGIAGEIASRQSDGPGGFQQRYLDALFNLRPAEIENLTKVSASK